VGIKEFSCIVKTPQTETSLNLMRRNRHHPCKLKRDLPLREPDVAYPDPTTSHLPAKRILATSHNSGTMQARGVVKHGFSITRKLSFFGNVQFSNPISQARWMTIADQRRVASFPTCFDIFALRWMSATIVSRSVFLGVCFTRADRIRYCTTVSKY